MPNPVNTEWSQLRTLHGTDMLEQVRRQRSLRQGDRRVNFMRFSLML